MTKKNFLNNIFVTATIVATVFTLCFGIYEYRREHAFRCDILHAKLQLNNFTRKDSTIRVTVIDTLGNVVYDNFEANVQSMGNHLHRKEVIDALQNGSGYDIKRASATNGENYFYSATYFPERGEIVRSSVPYTAPLTASLERDYTFFYYTMGIIALIVIVIYLRYRLGKSEKEKLRIKRQLTENAAHELKTPAATIHGYLETLMSNPDISESKRNEFIERCFNQSVRMSRLLSDMNMLTRLDEAQINRPSTMVDVMRVTRQIVSETQSAFEEKNILVTLRMDEEIMLKGDESLIYSMIRNIFDNVLFHAVGATRFDVSMSVSSGKKMRFVFSDNGVGVSSEHLSHIFERFYRLDKGRSRRLGGTGLGLAIVKNIIHQYDGSINALPTEGGGLTLVLEFHEE